MYRYEMMINKMRELEEFKGYIMDYFVMSKLWFEKKSRTKEYLIEYANGITETFFQPRVYVKQKNYEYRQIKHPQTESEIQQFIRKLNIIIQEANSDYTKIMPYSVLEKEEYKFIIRHFYETNGTKANPLSYPQEIRIHMDISKQEDLIRETELVFINENFKNGTYPKWRFEKQYTFSKKEKENDLDEIVEKQAEQIEIILNKPYRFAHLHNKESKK